MSNDLFKSWFVLTQIVAMIFLSMNVYKRSCLLQDQVRAKIKLRLLQLNFCCQEQVLRAAESRDKEEVKASVAATPQLVDQQSKVRMTFSLDEIAYLRIGHVIESIGQAESDMVI